MGSTAFERLRRNTFMFQPDRVMPLNSQQSLDGLLERDGVNLAGVLGWLQADQRLAKYVALVQQVFPNIASISSNAISTAEVETYLWPLQDRHQSKVRLRDSGRGIAPVLAILYVLFLKDQENCRIIVDEPQAFLHPGALRSLLTVFRRFPQHQFILATHSPIVITAADVQQCLLVQQTEGVSTVAQVDVREITGARTLLAEVGASLYDVFGSESVLWVEGPTEKACFERIIESDENLRAKPFTIQAVKATGDFDGQDAQFVADVYTRLAQGNALVPPAVAFQFDREGKTDQQMKELRNRLGSKAYFTERRMLENYLLHPAAVASLINEIDAGRNGEVTLEQVRELFDRERAKANQDWIREAHGANFLKLAVKELTEARCDYRKLDHGRYLTDWLLRNAPDELRDLHTLLTQILQACDSTR